MYNNLCFIRTTLNLKRLSLISVFLLTQACTHTPSIDAHGTLLDPSRDIKENHNRTTPNIASIASSNENSLVIYVYPQSGPINKGKYYRLYHR